MSDDSAAYLAQLRSRANSQIAENALALSELPNTDGFTAAIGDGSYPPPSTDYALPTSDWGSFQLALGPIAKRGLMTAMRMTGADKRVDSTVSQLTGGALSHADIRELEDRALTAAGADDVHALTGISEGTPVYLSPQQKTVVDGLMGKIGTDPLADRARTEYQHAIRTGQIRIR